MTKTVPKKITILGLLLLLSTIPSFLLASTPEYKALLIKKEAGSLMEARRYEEAIEKYKESLSIDPNLVVNYYNIGTSYAHLDQKEKAIEYFYTAIEHGYNETRLHYNMGYFFMKWEMYEDAITSYEVAYKMKPKAHNTILNLGLAYKKAGYTAKAKAVLTSGAQLYPKSKNILRTLDNLEVNESWNQETKNPEYTINKCKKLGQSCEKAGFILLKANKKKQALEYFKTACDKNYSMSCAQGGWIAYEFKDLKLSRALYQKGCYLKKLSACGNLAELLWEAGEKEQAHVIYRTACNLGDPRSCGIMGDYVVDTNPLLAKRWYLMSCELGNKEGCRRHKMVK